MEITLDVLSKPESNKPYPQRFRTTLVVRHGIVMDKKMKATRLSADTYLEKGKIIIHPDKDGDIKCYDGIIDLTGVLNKIKGSEYTINHHDIFGIIIELKRRE